MRHVSRGLLRSTLAAWLLVAATSPAFADDHPDGDKPHAHGLGLFAGPSGGLHRAGSGQDLGSETRHFHILIFGVELHIPASCPWAAGGNSTCSTPGTFFELAANVMQARDVPVDPIACAAEAGNSLVSLSCSPDLACDVAEIIVSDTLSISVSHLCDLARGLRSGAQQI